MSSGERVVILDNIRSAQNVGTIFRTADAAGVSQIYLVGITPAPIDRFGRPVSALAKAALGAETWVSWRAVADIQDALREVRAANFSVVAVEQTSAACPLDKYAPPARAAYIFGNEVAGVDEAVCAQADHVVEIPMRGRKESLNVAVAAGIILFHAPCTSEV